MKIDISEQHDQTKTVEPTEQELIDEAIARGTQAAEDALEQEAEQQAQMQEQAAEDLMNRIDELEAQLTECTSQLDEAQQRADEATDKYVRLYASWENFRKRTEVERKAERERATQGLVSHLIVVLDDIDRALEHGKEHADVPELSGFLEGFEAVRTKFIDALSKEHVREINPIGEPFDALLHQAVATLPNEEAYDETVSAVFQKGYRMGEYVLRPAMVQITQGGPVRPPVQIEDKEDGQMADDQSAQEASPDANEAAQSAVSAEGSQEDVQ